MKSSTQSIHKIILDTSIQFEVIKNQKDVISLINSYRGDFKIYASYYSYYEFLTGFIRQLVDYHSLVKLLDSPSLAMSKISDKFGRGTKYIAILTAIIYRIQENEALLNTSPKFNTDNHLRLVELAIYEAIQLFNSGVILTGSFGDSDIVRYKIDFKESYADFVSLCAKNKIIPMMDYWSKHLSELKLLTDSIGFKNSKKYAAFYKRIEKIMGNIASSDNYRINHGIGDIIIAVDYNNDSLLLTMDSFFDLICPILSKKHRVVKKLT